MKPTQLALWILTLVAAFGVGRATVPGERGAPPPADSFREAFSDWNPLTRPYRVSAVLQGLGPEQLPDALAAFEEFQIGVTPEEVRLLMLAWARFDAPGAFAWAQAWPTPWRKTLIAEAAFAWGHQDGLAALRTVEALEDEEQRGRLRSSVMDGWIRSDDRMRLVAEIAARDEPQIRRRLTFVLVGEQRKHGIDAMKRFVEELPDDTPNYFKRNAFYHATVSLAREDPRVAAAWLAEQGAREYSLDAAPGIARKWAEKQEPEALFAWARSLPADDPERREDRDEAIREGFRVWRHRSPAAAEAWLEAALPDPLLDPALDEMVRALAQENPSQAAEWALRIEDDTLRRRKLHLAGRLWARQDPVAVRAWIVEHEIPDELGRAMLAAKRSLGEVVEPAAAAQIPETP